MVQTILLRKWSIHVPSISRARLLPTPFLRRPMIYMEGYTGNSWQVTWPLGGTSWDEAKKEYHRLLEAMEACNNALDSVPKASYSEQKKELI